MTNSPELPDLPDVPDVPESTSPDVATVIGLVFVGLIVSLVPLLGAFLLFGIGLALVVSGNTKRRGAAAQRKHGAILEASTPVVVGQVVTVEGTIRAGTTVTAPLSGETAALAVCCGYHQTSNVGNRELLFRRTLGGPLEIVCGGRAVRISGERADVLCKQITTKTSEKGWGESVIGKWFYEVRPPLPPGTARHTNHMVPVYEFEESLIMPGDSITATGVVSAITDLEPGETASNGSVRQRLILDAPADGVLELTTLASSELAATIAQGKSWMIAGVLYEVLAVASSVAWYRFAQH